MESIRTEVKALTQEIYDNYRKENEPDGIKEKIKRFIDHIRFRKYEKNCKELSEQINMLNRMNKTCEFYPVKSDLYIGYYYENGTALLSVLEEDVDIDDNLCANLRIMLPFIGSEDQVKNNTFADLEFYGVHPVIKVDICYDEILYEFDAVIKKALEDAVNIYNKYKQDFQFDNKYSFFVKKEVLYFSLYSCYYPKLGELLLEEINREKTSYHMPKKGQPARMEWTIEYLDKEQLYLELLIGRLFTEKLIPTITQIAWWFIPRYSDVAKKIAEVAYELNDPAAKEVIDWGEDEDEIDNIFEGEIRHL